MKGLRLKFALPFLLKTLRGSNSNLIANARNQPESRFVQQIPNSRLHKRNFNLPISLPEIPNSKRETCSSALRYLFQRGNCLNRRAKYATRTPARVPFGRFRRPFALKL